MPRSGRTDRRPDPLDVFIRLPYRATAMNILRCFSVLAWLWLALNPSAPARAADRFDSAYLSEFLADNRQGLLDEDGERSGWIELHNGGKTPVNLSGWFLTDSPTNFTKWRFPGVVLLPDKYLVVFASAKDRAKDLVHLHTNFRLDPRGSYLALVNPAKQAVSEFTPTPQTVDVSDGRVRGEPAIRGHFQKPTPGKPNASSGPGFASAVRFSKPSGNFTAPFTLALACKAEGAVIRYTLDGTMPSRLSPVYAAPLLITNTAYVRAKSYREGFLPGPPHGEAYLLLSTNVASFTSKLPVLVMDTLGRDTAVSARSAFVHLSFYEPVNGRTALMNPPALVTRGGFHMRGSSSSGMPQASFAMQFLDEFNQEHHRAPLGLPAESDWVLYAPNGFDPVMIHNPFVHQLSRDLGRYSPRTRFVEVYLVKSGGAVKESHYNGIYVLEEKIKIGKHRIDIAPIHATDLKAPEVTGGYVLKFDRTGPGESGFNAGGVGMVYVDPKEQTLRLPQRAAQQNYLTTYFNDCGRALNGNHWKDPILGYRAYFDVSAAIDFHVLEVLSGNVDSMALSTYFHKPRDGKITFGPHWDFDRALGSTDGRDADPRNWNTGPFFGYGWWPRLFSDPDFWQLWVDRWQELHGTYFSQTHINGLIDRLTDELREAQPREVKRWGLQPRGGSYQSEINHMKNWLSNRVDFIDRQLTQPPRLSRDAGPGGVSRLLTLTANTNATIYYTLDGSDPRLPQGAIRTNAFLYAGPVTLKTNAHLVARAHNAKQRQTGGPPSSTPWSGPLTTNLVITPR